MKSKSKLVIMILLTVVLSFQGMLMVSAGSITSENFTPEAVITLLNDKELSVEFSHSGELPKGTSVTIYIPQEATYFFNNGDALYFYYNNPETGLREYIGEGRCIRKAGEMGKTLTSFNIDYSGEYIITYEYQGESYRKIDMGVPIGFCIFVAAGLFLSKAAQQLQQALTYQKAL